MRYRDKPALIIELDVVDIREFSDFGDFIPARSDGREPEVISFKSILRIIYTESADCSLTVRRRTQGFRIVIGQIFAYGTAARRVVCSDTIVEFSTEIIENCPEGFPGDMDRTAIVSVTSQLVMP